MSVDVCRLCLSKEDLIWIFDSRMADNMKDIIFITSGVEITQTDNVTQKVCGNCCQITIKMFKFRTTSIKNDKDLKAKYAQYFISQLQLEMKQGARMSLETRNADHDEKSKNTHSSVEEITTKNAVKKSSNLLETLNSEVRISLLANEVEQWFKNKNISDEEIENLKKQALSEEIVDKSVHVEEPLTETVQSKSPTLDKASETSQRTIGYIETGHARNGYEKPGPKSRKKPRRIETTDQPQSDEVSDVANEESSCKRAKLTEKIADQTVPVEKPLIETAQTKSPTLHEASESSRRLIGGRKTSRPITYNEGLTYLALTPPNRIEIPTTTSKAPRRKHSATAANLNSNQSVVLENRKTTITEENSVEASAHSSKESDLQINASLVTANDVPAEADLPRYDASDEPHRADGVSPSPSHSSGNTNSSNESDGKNLVLESLLLSEVNKIYKLHRCKVCDSHHYSLKELRMHERRSHTKCPFCNKKFRSSQLRDDHINSGCEISLAISNSKKARVVLTRVDQIEELRNRYSQVFATQLCTEDNSERQESVNVSTKDSSINKEIEVVNSDELPVEHLENLSSNKENENVSKDLEKTNQEVQNTSKELEKCMSNQQVQNTNVELDNTAPSLGTEVQQSPATSSLPKTSAKRQSDVICISDDEAELLTPRPSTSSTDNGNSKRIKLLNNELLRNVNLQDTDVNVLKSILSEKMKLKDAAKAMTQKMLKDNKILDGGGGRVTIFKNLKQHLWKYKIPVEITYSNKLDVTYKPAKRALPESSHDLWLNMTPKNLDNCVKPPVTSTLPSVVPTSTNNTYTILYNRPGNQTVINSTSHQPVVNSPATHQTVINSANPHTVINSSSVLRSYLATQNLSNKPTQPTINVTHHESSLFASIPAAPTSFVANPTRSDFNNILVVPSASTYTLPQFQGPLPIIQSIHSGQDIVSLSNTNTHVPVSMGIRVRNINDLS